MAFGLHCSVAKRAMEPRAANGNYFARERAVAAKVSSVFEMTNGGSAFSHQVSSWIQESTHAQAISRSGTELLSNSVLLSTGLVEEDIKYLKILDVLFHPPL